MHMLSKKVLSSEELDTLKRPRTPTTVLTANGEVQTNEETQVYVHDLELFVMVQMLDDTLAVVSRGKLCEDHGYSCEWVSGQKPRLTKEGKTIICKTEQLRTSRKEVETASGNSRRFASSSSSSLVLERSDEIAPGNRCDPSKNKNKNKQRDDREKFGRPVGRSS